MSGQDFDVLQLWRVGERQMGMPDRLVAVPGDQVDTVTLVQAGESEHGRDPRDFIPRQRPDLPAPCHRSGRHPAAMQYPTPLTSLAGTIAPEDMPVVAASYERFSPASLLNAVVATGGRPVIWA